MSRPKNPDWTVGSFATETSYAAGPHIWSSNPIKVQHPARSGGFVPGQGAAAPNVNYELNRLYVNDQHAKDTLAATVGFVGQMPALNWRRTTASIATTSSRPFYSAAFGAWIVPGTAAVHYSPDGGLTLDNFGVPNTSGEVLTCGDADASGNMVVSSQSRYVFRRTSGAWSRVDVAGASGGVYELTQVVHDPIRDHWIWFVANVNQFAIKTSNDGGATWTNAEVWPGGNWASSDLYRARLAVKKSTGRVVAIAQTFDGAVEAFAVATSDDGGATWTARANIEDAAAGESTRSDLTYDAGADAWYFAFGKPGSGKLYRSVDDGVSWMPVTSLTTRCLTSIACYGAMLVGLAETGEISTVAYSLDGGATWIDSQLRASVASEPCAVRAGLGDLMIAGGGYVMTSLRMGMPGQVIA